MLNICRWSWWKSDGTLVTVWNDKPARADLFCAYFPENVYTTMKRVYLFTLKLAIKLESLDDFGRWPRHDYWPWIVTKKMGEISWENDGKRILSHAEVQHSLKWKPSWVESFTSNFRITTSEYYGWIRNSREVRFTPKEHPVEVRQVTYVLQAQQTILYMIWG